MKLCNAEVNKEQGSEDVVLFYTTNPDGREWTAALQDLGVPAQLWPDDFEPEGRTQLKLDAVTFAICWSPPPGLLRKCPNLVAVHALGAGVDSVLPEADPVMSERMATWVAWAVTNCHRRMDEYLEGQRARQWMHYRLPVPDNGDYRVTVLGRGVMGLATARHLHLLGYDVCTVSRRPLTAKDEESQHGMRNVTVERVADVLPETDALVCLLPLTDATRGFVAAPLLERLKRGAVFINGGRGEHVVEDDLLAALDSGSLAKAVLDVTLKEPLPKDSPLWSHPKVRLTAHTAADANQATALKLITENFKRNKAGQDMVPVVDPLTGY